ncbi:hypothetical protein COLO4_13101 [Corchorus olitorius]|uniref:Uncharacterized protein n=1 Tax=Corchorus olitorius TaxID=93759 RepID=A0A1R3JY07_9ROSI|nr:hypothetical protein COLO4_13101 [Corchorus olitorius]
MGTSSFTFQIPKALPSISHSPSNCRKFLSYNITSQHKPTHNSKLDDCKKQNKVTKSINIKPNDYFDSKKTSLAIQVAALLATFEQPALAVTGVNNEPDLFTVIIQLGIIAFWYFLIMPETPTGSIIEVSMGYT